MEYQKKKQIPICRCSDNKALINYQMIKAQTYDVNDAQLEQAENNQKQASEELVSSRNNLKLILDCISPQTSISDTRFNAIIVGSGISPGSKQKIYQRQHIQNCPYYRRALPRVHKDDNAESGKNRSPPQAHGQVAPL